MLKNLTVLVVLFLTSVSFATTYYVSELFGDDGNNGTSISTPFATIQRAADVMVAGDSVLVDFGQYNETVFPKANGTPGNPIVYKSMTIGDAEITYGDTTMIPSFSLHSGSIYVMTDVFRTIDFFSEDAVPLIRKVNLDSLTAGSFFHDRAEHKLYVWSSDGGDPATHQDIVYFTKNSFDIVEGSYLTIDGFRIKGSRGLTATVAENLVPLPDLIIQNNIFEGSGLARDEQPWTWDEAMILEGGAANATNTYEDLIIRHNEFLDWYRAIVFSNCGRNGLVSANSFIRIGIAPDPDLQNVETINIQGDNDYPEVPQTDGLVFERNYFKVWGRCFYLRYGNIDDITMVNNIADKPGAMFMINYDATNVHIINNTIYGCYDNFALRYNVNAKHGRIYNNIFAFNVDWSLFFDNTGDTVNTALFDHNYWVTDSVASGSHPDHALVRSRVPKTDPYSSPGGPNGIYGHPLVPGSDTLISAMTGDTLYWTTVPDMTQLPLPLFVNPAIGSDTTVNLSVFEPEDFALDPSSLAINAGLASVAPVNDFYGHIRDANPDMGAIEFGATGLGNLDEILPKDIALYQNYPNPFNPTTTIKYKIPSSGHLTLEVYNLLGQKVKTLFTGFQQVGTHQVAWDGLNDHGHSLSGGIYFCRIKTSSQSRTIKMILLK